MTRTLLAALCLVAAAGVAHAQPYQYQQPSNPSYRAYDCDIGNPDGPPSEAALALRFGRNDLVDPQFHYRYQSRGDSRFGMWHPTNETAAYWKFVPLHRSTIMDNPELRILGCFEFASDTWSRAVAAYGTLTKQDGESPELHGFVFDLAWDDKGSYHRWRKWFHHSCLTSGFFPIGHFVGPAGAPLFFQRDPDGDGAGIYLAAQCGDTPRGRLLPDSGCPESRLTAPVVANPEYGPAYWRAQGHSCKGGLGYWETRSNDGNIYWVGNDQPPPDGECEDELEACNDALDSCSEEYATCNTELSCVDLTIAQFQAALERCR